MKYVNPFFLASIIAVWIGLVGTEALTDNIIFNAIVIIFTYFFSILCFDTSFYSYYNFKNLIFYVIWLIPKIIQSSVDLVKLTWQDQLRYDGKFLTIFCKELSPNEKIILANIITMTPGTITLDVSFDHLLVHAIVKNNDSEEVMSSMELMKRKIISQRHDFKQC